MAAPRKKKLDYFPLDSDFFSDKKIKVVLARYGADGVALYLYILCEIYKNSYYTSVDDDFYYVASADLNMSSEKVKQVLNFLLKRSLFDNKLFQSDKVLTSTGIQKRYQEAVRERAKKNRIMIQDYWLLSQEDTQPYIDVTHFDDFPQKNKSNSGENKSISGEKPLNKSKVKESKVEESKTEKNKLRIDPDFGEVISLYESYGFRINGYTSTDLSDLIEEYSKEWVVKAIRRAADMSKLQLGYVKGILNNWKISGGIDNLKKSQAYEEGWEDL